MIKLVFCLFVQRLRVLSLGHVYFPFLIKVRCRTEKLKIAVLVVRNKLPPLLLPVCYPISFPRHPALKPSIITLIEIMEMFAAVQTCQD